ncbi:MAG: hypothetical protein HRT52_12020 [Colwellia sp.]|nr:hypothetical protein [Colwellia sp.]
MKHRTSFGFYNRLSENVFEVIADEGVEITLEMIDECHEFVDKYIQGDFALLVNRINNYSYTYEAKLSIASYEGLKAIAFVYYNSESLQVIDDLQGKRLMDKWNTKSFSGLELGWQQAYEWLQQEMAALKVN